jgi:hypothetical protein
MMAAQIYHNTIETHNSLEVLRCGGHAFMWCYGFMDEAAPVLDAAQRSIIPTYPNPLTPRIGLRRPRHAAIF